MTLIWDGRVRFSSKVKHCSAPSFFWSNSACAAIFSNGRFDGTGRDKPASSLMKCHSPRHEAAPKAFFFCLLTTSWPGINAVPMWLCPTKRQRGPLWPSSTVLQWRNQRSGSQEVREMKITFPNQFQLDLQQMLQLLLAIETICTWRPQIYLPALGIHPKSWITIIPIQDLLT